MNITDIQIEDAIRKLEKIIDAARNSKRNVLLNLTWGNFQ